MNVVLYMRYSSDKQTEQSIEGQNRVCLEFCQREKYNIVGKYIDRATSAFKDADKRSEFQRMIKDSSKGNFDAVVVYKLDRFARNRYDSATYKAKLKRNGVKLISATENISDNPEGIILESVLEGMAEFYSQELSQKVKRGMNENALKHKSLGGQIPLGYKSVDKKLVIDESTAHIVKEAFELYVQDIPVVKICEMFNAKGYRTSTGGEFNKSSFARLLKNKKYLGILTFHGQEIPNAVPKIIDEELFNKASEKIVEISKAPARNKTKVDYILSGKLFCGHCGAPMCGMSGTSRTGEKHYYYSCLNHRKGSCDKKNNLKEKLEQYVIEDTYNLLTPEIIDQIAEIAVKECERIAKDESNVIQLQKEIRECDSKLNNLLRALETTPNVEILAKRIEALEQAKKGLEKQLAQESHSVILLEKEQVVWWLNQFLDGDVEDIEFRKRLVNLLVNRIDVYDEDNEVKIKITYNCIGNNETLSSSHLTDNGQPVKKINDATCVILY